MGSLRLPRCEITFNIGLSEDDAYRGSQLAFCGMFYAEEGDVALIQGDVKGMTLLSRDWHPRKTNKPASQQTHTHTRSNKTNKKADFKLVACHAGPPKAFLHLPAPARLVRGALRQAPARRPGHRQRGAGLLDYLDQEPVLSQDPGAAQRGGGTLCQAKKSEVRAADRQRESGKSFLGR